MAQGSETKTLRSVITAASAGTLIEWYDFFVFGALATVMADKFFPKGNETAALLSTLATFATGFIVRPFGAIVFGRLGDLVGRKYTFMLTLLLMGGSTFVIGLLPTYAQIGVVAPLFLVLLRMVQGLALGGEYGGAATYVAEHAAAGKRGLCTSYIQTTATLGLFVSILVIIATKASVGIAAFNDWGWRVPFLVSILLVFVSYFIRVRMSESPLFAKLKSEGKTSVNPLRESFVNPENRRLVLLSLFGATMGQGVVWYTGQFYALYFMQKSLKLPDSVAYTAILIALALGTPFFIVFGALSDKVGRKKIILLGSGLATVLFWPLFQLLASFGQPAAPNIVGLIAVLFVMVILVTMVYGPIAAYLVELFPTKIRYTSMSLPYHLGNGVFGGLVPLIATALVAQSGNIYLGLVYPILIAGIGTLIGAIWLPETTDASMIADA